MGFMTPWRFNIYLAGIYLLKVNNKNTRTRCEKCSNLTMKTPELRQWHRPGVFIVNFEQISHLVLVFLLLTLKIKSRKIFNMYEIRLPQNAILFS